MLAYPAVSFVQGQGANRIVPETPTSDSDHIKEPYEWFFRGRLVPGKPFAELRRRAYQANLRLRAQHVAERNAARVNGALASLSGTWTHNGSQLIYATTSGLGPINGPLSAPAGGRVWVTTNATLGPSSFAGVTENGPQGSINPNQFPISGVALDPLDHTGATAYVTVMGFTGGTGHVWKTTTSGATWIDFTANLPDSPVNAVIIDPTQPRIYVGTAVGVFTSSTALASWTEVGPDPSTNQPGFLPDVAVTALGIFNYGSQELLRASTYGPGIWQFVLMASPNFQLSISNSPLTSFSGQTAALNGAATAVNGYADSLTLTCTAGATAPPSTCIPSPASLTPGTNAAFAVTVGGADGDYSFNVNAVGSDTKHITQQVPVTVAHCQFRTDHTVAGQRDRGAGNYIFSGIVSGHCRRIVQSERRRFVRGQHSQCNLYSDARQHGHSHSDHASEHDGEHRRARRGHSRELSCNHSSGDCRSASLADDSVHTEGHGESELRCQ